MSLSPDRLMPTKESQDWRTQSSVVCWLGFFHMASLEGLCDCSHRGFDVLYVCLADDFTSCVARGVFVGIANEVHECFEGISCGFDFIVEKVEFLAEEGEHVIP